MNSEIERALLRALCTLIDTGEYALGKEEAETATEQAVVNFMRMLRIGSRVSVRAANVWTLELPAPPEPEELCAERCACGGEVLWTEHEGRCERCG